jgi:type IV pilus assembly protein PilO
VADARAVVAANDTAQLRTELEKRQQELDLAKQLLPDRENLPVLLRSITRTGEFNNLNFLLFEPQSVKQLPLYQERPYKIKVRGGYHETARFLSEVADMDMIVKPTSLSMLRDSRQDSPDGETVTADVTLTTYLLIPAPKLPARQQQKGN